MNYDFVKYERGQLWMVRFKNPKEHVGHEQAKDRPWLVVSVGKFNKSSGMVTMVPVTTRDEARTVAEVRFTDGRGKSSVILCEGIRTFDYTSGAYQFDYYGTVSDEVLEKVDVALSIHLGMHYSPITLKKLYDSMEAIIKSIGYMQDKSNTPKFTDKDVSDFADSLLTEAKRLSGFGINEQVAELLVQPVHVLNKDDPKVEVIGTSKPKRRTWTVDKMREYLNDCYTLPMKDIIAKWELPRKSAVYSTKAYLQKRLEEEVLSK